jgi:hypothetical protein
VSKVTAARAARPHVVAASRLARSMPPAEVDAFMGDRTIELVPAIERKEDKTAFAVAHELARAAAVDLAMLRHSTAVAEVRLSQAAQARENLRAAFDLVDSEFAKLQSLPIRQGRVA